MKTIVALYDQRRTAVRAVRELLAHGIPKDRISFVSPAGVTDAGRSHLPLDEDEDDAEAGPDRPRASEGSGPVMVGMPDAKPPQTQTQTAGVGATLGIGSVLLGVAFLSLPAVGPVLAAGPLLAGIAVSGAGASGDLPTRLNQSGMPAADAERYARAVARGGVLVVVTLGTEHVEDAAIILARHSPIEPTSLRAPPSTDPPAHVQPRLQATRPTMSSAARPA
jgi:hypothetical protein